MSLRCNFWQMKICFAVVLFVIFLTYNVMLHLRPAHRRHAFSKFDSFLTDVNQTYPVNVVCDQCPPGTRLFEDNVICEVEHRSKLWWWWHVLGLGTELSRLKSLPKRPVRCPYLVSMSDSLGHSKHCGGGSVCKGNLFGLEDFVQTRPEFLFYGPDRADLNLCNDDESLRLPGLTDLPPISPRSVVSTGSGRPVRGGGPRPGPFGNAHPDV